MCAFAVRNTVEKSCCIPSLQPLYTTLTLSRAGCRAPQLYSIQLYSAQQYTPLRHPSGVNTLWRHVDGARRLRP
eukprot:5965392-Prymnesium_polylepis.1